ncbi:DUF5060 domain-containing protein [Paenibacillus sp. P25]|nr:DUF5060 domain-containing protein [Paenibacillus sp. P25]
MIEERKPDAAQRWGRFELRLKGPDAGNPFQDVRLEAEFRHKHRKVHVDGFYDGSGVYKIRFMPDAEGGGFIPSAAAAPNWTG